MHHQVNWDGERKQQNKTHLMLGNIGSEGRVAGSLLLFLVEVACQLVWLHVFVFMSCFVYVSRNSVNLFTFSFYSLRSPRCCARLHGCKGAGQRCCQQPFGAPTGACELSYSASSRLRFFWSGFIFALSLISWILFGIVHVDQPGTICSV